MKISKKYIAMISVVFCAVLLILKPTNEDSIKEKSRIIYKQSQRAETPNDENIKEVIDNTDGKIREMPVPSPNESLDVKSLPIPNPNDELVITGLNYSKNFSN